MIFAPIMLLLAAQEPACDKRSVPDVSSFDAANPRPPEEASGDGLWIGGQAFGTNDLAASKAVQSEYSGEWVVNIELTPAGVAKFATVQRCRLGKAFEISVDGKVITAPFLNEYITGNRAQLTGGFATEADATALAARIAAKNR